MANFSTDADLLTWEPALFRDLAVEGQLLVRGIGASALGYEVTAAEADFVARRVQAGHVLRLVSPDLGIDGCYEVVSVESEAALTAAVVGGTPGQRAPLPDGADLDFSIHTFDPQHEEARWALLARFGLEADPSDPAADLEGWIFQHRSLRRASVALVLATLFRGQAAADAGLERKADHYARLYEDEVAKVRLALDRDGDGRPDDVRSLTSHRLRRD